MFDPSPVPVEEVAPLHRCARTPEPPPIALTIAGSDPSGGAGIQADLKTFHTFGVYGATVITSLTVQNTCGVRSRDDVSPDLVVAQLVAVQDDLAVAAAKTGLLATVEQIEALAAHLTVRPISALVVDPVLVATSGHPLTEGGTVDALRRRLLPLAVLITPNLTEAEALTGRSVRNVPAMREAAQALVDLGAGAALVKGGHLEDSATDVLLVGGRFVELATPRLPIGTAHGTGCSLSAAVTAGLAKGHGLEQAVVRAKAWLTNALAAAPAVGHGHRPVDHRVRPEEP